MNKVYIAMESMGALILLILLLASIFEIRQDSVKRKLFIRLLIGNELVVVSDVITWLSLEWSKMTWLLWALIAVTYIVPFFVLATFSKYLYVHISEKTKISGNPFKGLTYLAIAVGCAFTVLCAVGKVFVIRDGKYYPATMGNLYYLFYIAVLLIFSGMILSNGKKMRFHDMMAAVSFCVVPLLSIVATSIFGINLAVAFMAIDILVIYILFQSERESKLINESNSDELTGLYNRRAYEDDMMTYPDVPPEPDFIYASIDINGLKVINDTLGHAAGDELICGAAYCLKRTLGNYGRVYRTGGDEFVSMFFADEKHLKTVLDDLKELTDQWHGTMADSLSLAVGYAAKREFTTETVEEMSQVAEKRMYKEKERYYADRGVDRRGQNEAHKVLCALYTKILKVNITKDSCAIVNMNLAEQTKEMGFSESISEWLEGFGRNGYVHPEDLEEYLAKTNIEYMRGYFKRKKTSLTVLYRRKYDDGFKQVMMEIIPANDYSDQNQSLFLYVKNIDI